MYAATPPNHTRPTALGWIPGGDAGTLATLVQMRALARDGVRDPLVRAVAARFAGYEPAVQVATLRSWLAMRWHFAPDPRAHETLVPPGAQLRVEAQTGRLAGDCDDGAILAASLLLALGIPARFVVLGFGPGVPPFQHVFTEAHTPSGWQELDVTARERKPPTRRWTMEV